METTLDQNRQQAHALLDMLPAEKLNARSSRGTMTLTERQLLQLPTASRARTSSSHVPVPSRNVPPRVVSVVSAELVPSGRCRVRHW